MSNKKKRQVMEKGNICPRCRKKDRWKTLQQHFRWHCLVCGYVSVVANPK